MKFHNIALAATAAFTLGSLATSAQALTPKETSAILFMKQEEKLARDVYRNLHARWGLTVFANIAQSEERHMGAVDSLILRYSLNDPTPAHPGKFTYPALQKLHDQLVTQGAESAEAALNVGVVIEEADIADLKESLSTARTATVKMVFRNLLRGSRNHLEAFQKCLANGCDGTAQATQGKATKRKVNQQNRGRRVRQSKWKQKTNRGRNR